MGSDQCDSCQGGAVQWLTLEGALIGLSDQLGGTENDFWTSGLSIAQDGKSCSMYWGKLGGGGEPGVDI